MDKTDLSRYGHVHFIGIGGISMSGLAEILHARGIAVSGSDLHSSPLTDRLAGLGISIRFGQCADNITPGIGLVVYTAAVAKDNPELAAAQGMGIPAIGRAELLGLLLDEYPYSVCISGTHGKTTTTSMVAEIFMAAGTDPTVTVGGILPSIGGNIRIGSSDYFIAEACEYCDSFLQLNPYVGVVLNIDLDHVDYFKDIDQLTESFRRFAHNIRPGGTLVINAGIGHIDTVTAGLECRLLTYGEGGELHAEDICYDADGCAGFTPVCNGRAMERIQLRVPGVHNVANALAAYAAASSLGIGAEHIRRALAGYSGAQRRFELKGSFNGAQVFDDYAHHPSEIRATLAAAGRRQYNKLWCVFQPHTYSRTRALLPELAEAFECADEVIIVDIYAAREKNPGDIHSRDLVERINNLGKSCRYFPDFASVEKFLSDACIPNDMLITMGAGDVYLIGEALVGGSY